MSSADAGSSANMGDTPHSAVPPQPQTVPGESESIRLEDFQIMLGIDGCRAPRYVWLPRWMQPGYREPQDTMALYPKILMEEKTTLRQLYAFDLLVYTCLALQLVIASTLVILSAINGDHHITVAILGAITALIAGVLSMIKGQGQPMRLLNYADSLKKVREDIEFCESGLKAKVTGVTYKQVLDIWNKYTSARDSQMKNRPDVWAPQQGDTRTT